MARGDCAFGSRFSLWMVPGVRVSHFIVRDITLDVISHHGLLSAFQSTEKLSVSMEMCV
jgi:hypothetical protein